MKKIGRKRRHKSIARKVRGVESRPRLVVFRSKKHIYAQVINDAAGKVITAVSTLSKEFSAKGGSASGGKEKKIKTTNQDAAKEVGKIISEKVKSLGVETVSFDRGGYKYHGRVKKLAEGAREGGLKL
ncbi:MAG: 50S ribosomal protein L18 [Candidatus Susulua stagnicola]|nr:50S ribosomal protein L18 [Candidatus Susulua stagnicola]